MGYAGSLLYARSSGSWVIVDFLGFPVTNAFMPFSTDSRRDHILNAQCANLLLASAHALVVPPSS